MNGWMNEWILFPFPPDLYNWDKIFLIGPKNIFHDDHERYMAHADLVIRNDLYEILCKNIKEAGYWDKVEILDGDFYENFIKVVDYVNGVINKWVKWF